MKITARMTKWEDDQLLPTLRTDCNCRRQNTPDFLANATQLLSHSQRDSRCLIFSHRYLSFFFMPKSVDLGTGWLILSFSVWNGRHRVRSHGNVSKCVIALLKRRYGILINFS